MRKHAGSVPGLLFVAAVLAGCADRQAPTAPDPGDTAPRGSSAAQVRSGGEDRWRPGETRSAQVAARVPGFGGFSFDSTGNMIVYLADPNDRGAADMARAALAPYHRSQRGGWKHNAASPQVFVRQARFTFDELRRYRALIEQAVFETPGVIFLDLDENANRLVIGLDRASAGMGRLAVEGEAKRRGVPTGALEFETRVIQPCLNDEPNCPPLVAPDYPPGVNTSIQGEIRPLVGGVKVTSVGPPNAGSGTVGFIVYHCRQSDVQATVGGCGYWYVVTAHQTGRLAVIDGTQFYQPEQNTFNGGMGSERIDTQWSSYLHTINPDGVDFLGNQCQPYENYRSFVCRRTDMALVLAEGPVPYKFGHLVRPAHVRVSRFEVNPADPTMPIAGEGIGDQHQIVDKIGANTGWTYGTVNRTCVDMVRQINDPAYQNLARYVLRCQTEVLWSQAGYGDSGAPVFKYDTNTRTATLLGLFHGGSSYGAGNAGYEYYSSMANIRNDLGLPLDNTVNFKVR